MSSAKDFFQVEMTGGTIVITPIGDINSLSAELLHEAAEMMTELIESNESPMLVIDLSNVPSCGSVFKLRIGFFNTLHELLIQNFSS